MQIEGRWITYISVYAPTDDSSQKIKDGFYIQKLQSVLDKTPRGEKLVILGDLNARVGNNNDGWEKVLATHVKLLEMEMVRGFWSSAWPMLPSL